jgi:Tfp pilus assembly PilM family ATPase
MMQLEMLRGMTDALYDRIKVGTSTLSPIERQNLQETIKTLQPANKREREIEALLGRRMTKGQYARYAAAGTLAGLISQAVTTVVDAESPAELLKTLKSPKELGKKGLKAAITGTLFATAIPVIKRELDYQAVKRGKY